MKRLITTLAVILVAGLAAAQPKHNCPGCPSAEPRPPAPAPMIEPAPDNELPELTPEQQDRMDVAKQNHLRTILPIETDLQIKELELAALWRAEKFDARKITAKVREITELRGRLELERVNHLLAIREILTPEQRKGFMPMLFGRGRRGPLPDRGRMRGCGPDRGCRGDCHDD